MLTLFSLRNSEADFVVKNKSIGLLRNMGRIKKICEPSWVILIENQSHSFFRLIGQAFWEPEMESIWTFIEGYQMEPYHVTLNSSFCHNVPIVFFGGILLQTQETIFFSNDLAPDLLCLGFLIGREEVPKYSYFPPALKFTIWRKRRKWVAWPPILMEQLIKDSFAGTTYVDD